MSKFVFNIFILCSLVLAPIAQAEREKVKLRGTTCHGSFQKFRCGHIGEVTIDEIYEKGWRVITAIEGSRNIVYLVIEEQEK